MKITRNVIEDLLPAYLAGEASADTRALVESYLEEDVELARRVRAGAGELLPDDLPTEFTKEAEMQSMERATKLTNLKAWAMAPPSSSPSHCSRSGSLPTRVLTGWWPAHPWRWPSTARWRQ